MKTWNKPELKELDINLTAQGKNMNSKYDEIRVDQNGQYWAGFGSGSDSNPVTDGAIEVK